MAIPTNCWKYLVLIFNFLFAISAVVIFAVSGLFLYRLFIYRHFIGVTAEYPAILLLSIAIVSWVVSWIGWRTGKTTHQFHIVMAGILILIVVIIEFGCFVWAMVVWDNTEIELKAAMTSFFEQTVSAKDPNSAGAIRWDKLQVKMECCGVSGPNDYSKSGQVPFSCCGQGPLDSVHTPYTSDCTALYQRGCGKLLHQYVQHQLLWVAIVALMASVLQSIGVFCTFGYVNVIRKGRKASTSAAAAADDSLLASPTAPKF